RPDYGFVPQAPSRTRLPPRRSVTFLHRFAGEGGMMAAVRERLTGGFQMRQFLRAAACLGLLFAVAMSSAAAHPTWSITLTGQSMIPSDVRAHVPAAVPVIKSFLGGDVVFTNFEATVLDVTKGQSPKDGRFLSPPETLDALKS